MFRRLFDRLRGLRSVPGFMPVPFDDPLLRGMATAAAAAALALFLLIGLVALSGMGRSRLDLLSQFTAQALMLTIVVTTFAALLRLRAIALSGLVVAALLVVAVWPQWITDRGRPRPGAPVITIYSANLWFHNADVAAIEASIKAADPDVVVLIEAPYAVSRHTDRVLSGYPYRLRSPWPGFGAGTAGNIIASRTPLVAGDIMTQTDVGYALARVQTRLGWVNVVGVHLARPWPNRVQWYDQISQIRDIETLVARLDGPVIVAGDFNSVSSGRIGRRFRARTGLKPNPGWPGTWPSVLPAAAGITVDQLYRSPDLAVVSRAIGKRTGSDHFPVVTRLTLAEP
jgi:endonuclease/exonuclease/phosphatase (EEP) superfamily protein YafD